MIQVNTAGSVDNGKSTLIGRLLYDCGGLPKDVIEKIARKSAENSLDGKLNLAFFTDGLRAEQSAGITIDVARHYVSRDKLDLIIADTPGHQEFTRNMLTGTSNSKATLILVDASKGIVKQNRRHAYIAAMMGVEQIIVLVNKMDLVGFSKDSFKALTEEFNSLMSQLDRKPPIYIPISALQGDNVVEKSTRMPWYHGESVIATIEQINFEQDLSLQDLRFMVQWIDIAASRDLGTQEVLGSVVSGSLSKGDELIILPSQQTAIATRIIASDRDLASATFPETARILLEAKKRIDRGSFITHTKNSPILRNRINAEICWMQEESLAVGKEYLVQLGSKVTEARVVQINSQINIESYKAEESKGSLELNDIAEVEIQLLEALPWEVFQKNSAMGRFIIIDKETKTTAAAGVVV